MEVSASHKGVNLLGTVTEFGETTVLECGGSFTGVTIQSLTQLQEKFGEKLVIILSGDVLYCQGGEGLRC